MPTSLHCALRDFVARLPRPSYAAVHDKRDRLYAAVQQAVTRLMLCQWKQLKKEVLFTAPLLYSLECPRFF